MQSLDTNFTALLAAAGTNNFADFHGQFKPTPAGGGVTPTVELTGVSSLAEMLRRCSTYRVSSR